MAADEAGGSSNQDGLLCKIDMCHTPMIHDETIGGLSKWIVPSLSRGVFV